MGTCYFCMKDHSDEHTQAKDKEKMINGKDQKPMDFSHLEFPGIDVNSNTPNPTKDTGNLMTNENNKDWNEDETEKLEHELEKEILSNQVSNATGINTKMMEELDDVLNDSLEESDDLSVDENEMDALEMDKDGNTEKHRRNSNLFRYKSQKSWDNADLDQQQDDLQKQMDLLKQQSQNNAN